MGVTPQAGGSGPQRQRPTRSPPGAGTTQDSPDPPRLLAAGETLGPRRGPGPGNGAPRRARGTSSGGRGPNPPGGAAAEGGGHPRRARPCG